jgi:hypothetical protein
MSLSIIWLILLLFFKPNEFPFFLGLLGMSTISSKLNLVFDDLTTWNPH